MRHFIYQDEKSHKFWAVEQQGNEGDAANLLI